MLGAQYVTHLESLGMTIDVVDGVDHTFKPVWSHDVLRRSLESNLPGLSIGDSATLTGSTRR